MRFSVFLIVFFCISCTQNPYESLISADIIKFDAFEKEVEKTSHLANIFAIGSYKLAVHDNYLVVITVNSDSIVSIYDLKTEKLILQCCRIGRGPNEYLGFHTWKQFIIRNKHICLQTYDSNYEGMLLDISESINNQKAVHIGPGVRSKDFRQNNGILLLPSGERFVKFPVTYKDARDNLYYFPKYVFFCSDNKDNKDNKEIQFFNGNSFSISNPSTISIKLLMFDGSLRIKPDGTKAVDAFFHSEHINFLDLVNNRGFSVSYTQGLTVNDLAVASIEDILERYVEVYKDATVTDEHVFALYSGKPVALDGDTVPYTESAIRVFDWEGNPLVLVRVDRELISIAYHEPTKRIYALDSEENIIYYELDDVI